MSEARKNSLELSETAALAAISLVFLIIYKYFPVIGWVITFFSSLPILYAYLTKDIKYVLILIAAVSVVALLITADWMMVTAFLINFAAVGLLLGFFIKRHATAENTILLSSIALTLLFYLIIKGLFLVVHKDFVQMSIDSFMKIVNAVQRKGPQNAALYDTFKTQTLYMIKYGFIAIMFVSNLIYMAIVYYVSRSVLAGMGIVIPKIKNFSYFRVNNVSVSLLIASLALALPQVKKTSIILYKTGYNLRMIMLVLLTIIGLSIVNYWLRRFKISMVIKFILYFLIVAQFWYFLVFIGIIDFWVNFRKIGIEERGQK